MGAPGLVAVVARACAKDPAGRQPSAAALATEFAQSLGRDVPAPTPMPRPSFQAPREGPAPPPPPPLPAPAGRWEQGRRLRLVALLAAALALGLAGTALLIHGRTITTPAAR